MSEYADKHSKAHRKERVDHILGSTTKGKVDASGYEVPGEMDTEKKTGPCQPKPRAFAKGGKVEGHKAHHHAGRKSRALGGETAVQQLRPQVPTGGLYGAGFAPTHAGMLSSAAGLKKGGEAKKRACGGKAAERRLEMAKHEGRKARAEGGRAKGKTNINIIIGAPKEAGAGVPPPPSAMPPPPLPPRPGLPPAAMGAMSGPPGAMGGPGGAPPGMPPQMPPGMGPR